MLLQNGFVMQLSLITLLQESHYYKTFATIVTLSNGVPIETVSKLLGHTKISTTQVYARVLENKVSKDINALREILNQGKPVIPKPNSPIS